MEAFSFAPNEYIYTNLKDCRMTYEVLSCDIPMQGCFPYIGAWQIAAPALSPGETGQLVFRCRLLLLKEMY